MIDINWNSDYKGDFICPACGKAKLSLGGFKKGTRQFLCPKCKKQILTSIKLTSRSRYLDSRLKDREVDWERDYHGEFVCPQCNRAGMSVWGARKVTGKRQFWCSICRKSCQSSCTVDEIKPVEDPQITGLVWYTNHCIKDFICPECLTRNVYLSQIDKFGKKIFKCRSCCKHQYESIALCHPNFSYYSNARRPLKPFIWEEQEWDLRTISPNFDERDISHYTANFSQFDAKWFESVVKKYIYYLCKCNFALGSIALHLSSLRFFFTYLSQENISDFNEIDRSLILDYLSKAKKINKQKLGTLRSFFAVGTIKGWFNIDQDIIRDSDYPKQHRGNPDPISETVREQIEQHLHLLPDPIARMWLIGYFSAMRPSELALLKRDCLVQEGQYWKLVWHRKKTDDYHEIPISRTIAKVVQQQQDHIRDLWGDEWDYLFCHYHNLSSTDPSQPKLEPFKKILPTSQSHPLLVGIRSLIKFLNIRDENGQLAKFQSKLLRPTRLTELFERGHDLSVVSAWAGHKHFATTSTYYTQVSCELMEREAGHIHKALVNSQGHRLPYESFPKSFWQNPTAHQLELSGTHINTPIYGYCGLPLDRDCHKFRACYTCQSFVATIDKLPQYIKTRDELRAKQAKAMSAGQEVLVEQFSTQADRLDQIVAGLQQEAA